MNMIKSDVINAEMLVHVALCTHKEPKNILVLNPNDFVEQELNRHKDLDIKSCENISGVESLEDASIDVIVVNSTDYFEATFIAQFSRVLREDGLIVLQTADSLIGDLGFLGNLFGIAMTYEFAGSRAILASKKYHPTADIILQRADLIDGLSYYNAEIHLASFALPTAMKKELLGIQKN